MRVLLALAVGALLLAPAAGAAPGELDRRFGSQGLAAVEVHPGQRHEVRDIAVQPDGKIVLAGEIADPVFWTTSEPALARLNRDGTVDTAFGSGGVVVGDFGSATGDTAHAVALQPDGKIVIGGVRGHRDFALARYLPDGTLDTSFGDDGLVTTAFADGGFGCGASVGDVVVQPEGAIVAVGPACGVAGAARYLADGSPDTRFGDGGQLTFPLHGYGGTAIVAGFPHADGRITVAGSGWSRDSDTRDFFVLRLLLDGSADESFGDGGLVYLDHPGEQEARSATITPDGKVVVAGSWLGRVTADGVPDASFGPGGVRTPGAGDRLLGAHMVVAAPEGKLLVTGFGYTSWPHTVTAVARLLPNGSLDLSFGDGGVGGVTAETVGVPILAAWRAATVTPGGRLVTGGWSGSGAGSFAALRWHGGPTFADVSQANPFYGDIEDLYAEGITTGCGRDAQDRLLYCPGDPVPRQQMAAFLIRAKGLTPLHPPTPTFADVPQTNPFYGHIERLYQQGITTGCGRDAQDRLLYCPGDPVPRQQMAAFLIRAFR